MNICYQNKLLQQPRKCLTNLIQLPLANVVKLEERVEVHGVPVTLRAKVKVHQVRRITG